MSTRMKMVAALIIATCFVLQGQAQQGVKLKLKQGDRYYLAYKVMVKNKVSAEGNEMVSSAENILGTTYEVLSVDHDQYKIKATFSSAQFKAVPPEGVGEPMEFDSNKPQDMDGNFGDRVKEVIGKSIVFTFDAATSKLMQVEEDPQISLDQNQGGPTVEVFPTDEKQMASFAPKLFGGDIPNDAQLVAGYSWDQNKSETNAGISTTMKRHFVIKKIEQRTAFVEVDQTVTAGGTPEGSKLMIDSKSKAKGSKTVDLNTGLLTESKFENEGDQVVDGDNGRQSTHTSTTTILTVRKL